MQKAHCIAALILASSARIALRSAPEYPERSMSSIADLARRHATPCVVLRVSLISRARTARFAFFAARSPWGSSACRLRSLARFAPCGSALRHERHQAMMKSERPANLRSSRSLLHRAQIMMMCLAIFVVMIAQGGPRCQSHAGSSVLAHRSQSLKQRQPGQHYHNIAAQQASTDTHNNYTRLP
jgi:hypothetical protein